jgi:hypothetical protein
VRDHNNEAFGLKKLCSMELQDVLGKDEKKDTKTEETRESNA